ncbi:MAG TPA: hypothetical protein VJV79_27560 [Polyangiaceae bacterium]|nr:hypothetical protein [Polyangiaceae bacterium]
MKQAASSNIEAFGGCPPRSRLQTWLSLADSNASVIFLVIAGALWLASALGLDPTNVPQLQDYQHFHLPSVRTFASRPLGDALSSYRAAPFPLFYILGGELYRATESEAVLRIWTVAMAFGTLAFVFALARRAAGLRSTAAPLVVALAITSPYFRGQSVYANTDILALLCAFGALYSFAERPPRFPSIRACVALSLACCAVYTRQFYVFLPVYLWLRMWANATWPERIGSTLFCAVLAAPAIGLVLWWGQITPRGFSQHAAAPSLQHSVPSVLLLLAFYATPLAVVTAWKYRAAFVKDFRQIRLRLMMAPVVALGAYLMFAKNGIPDVVGGGMPLHFLRALPFPAYTAAVLPGLGVIIGGSYLAYIVHQNPLHNSIIVLVALCFFPTGILYQRYFDPVMPLLFIIVVASREVSTPTSRQLVIVAILFELMVTAVGASHYQAMFRTSALAPTASPGPQVSNAVSR